VDDANDENPQCERLQPAFAKRERGDSDAARECR
jgi:hypothetical protein